MKFVQAKREWSELTGKEKRRVLTGMERNGTKHLMHLQSCKEWDCEEAAKLACIHANIWGYICNDRQFMCSTTADRVRLVRCPARSQGRKLVLAGTELRRMFDKPATVANV